MTIDELTRFATSAARKTDHSGQAKKGSAAGSAFAEMMAKVLEDAKKKAADGAAADAERTPAVEEDAEAAEATASSPEKTGAAQGSADGETPVFALKDLSAFISGLFAEGTGAYDGWSLADLKNGLGDELLDVADRITADAREAGIALLSIQVNEAGIGSLYAVSASIYMNDVRQLPNGLIDLSRIQERIAYNNRPDVKAENERRHELYRELQKAHREDGSQQAMRDELERLAGRAAVVKAGDAIPGFAKEFAADPQGTLAKYSDQLVEYMKGVNVSYNARGESAASAPEGTVILSGENGVTVRY